MRWSASDLRRRLATAAAATPNPDEKTYQVVGELVVGHAKLLVALSPQRDPTLLVTGVHGHAAGTPQLEGDALASVLGRFGLAALAEIM